MEQKVKDTYKKIDEIKVYSTLAVVVGMCAIILMTCVIWGDPFGHSFVINGKHITYNDWLGDIRGDILLISIWVYGCFIILLQRKLIYRQTFYYASILLDKCDADLCFKYSTIGVAYGKELRNSVEGISFGQRVSLLFFENLHIVVLGVLGRYEDADAYYKNEWCSKVTPAIRRICKINHLNLAYTEEDLKKYKSMYSNYGKTVKYRKSLFINLLILEEKYEQAVQILLKLKNKNMAEKVLTHYKLGQCYKKLGLMSKSRRHYEFVAKYGNTMPVRQKALAELGQQP